MTKFIDRIWWGLVRFGFRLLYNEFAWTYDLVSWVVSLGHWRRWQRASIPYLGASDDLILELAHGTANLQIDLAAANYRSIGFDLSPHMGRIASRKLSANGLIPRLVRGSAMQLPFPGQCFQAIVSTFPTEFIIHSDTLHEAYRVLKPGGRFVVVPNGILTLANPLVWFLEWLYRITGQRGPWQGDPLQKVKDIGFDVTVHTEELPGSKVWIVVAQKPNLGEGETEH